MTRRQSSLLKATLCVPACVHVCDCVCLCTGVLVLTRGDTELTMKIQAGSQVSQGRTQ